MFLHLLTEESERDFFLMFAQMIAIAEKEGNIDDNFKMLSKFALEMGKNLEEDDIKSATKNLYNLLKCHDPKFVLDKFISKNNVTAFPVEKRKIILMEAIAMAYADGCIYNSEQDLIEYFCARCNLDKELIEEFREIIKQFYKLSAKSLELITE